MAEIYISDEVSSVIALYKNISPTLDVHHLLIEKSKALLIGHHSRHPGAAVEITCWFPGLIGKSASIVYDTPFGMEDAQLTESRIHGFRKWPEVENQAIELQSEFEQAVDLLLQGNTSDLESLLRGKPILINAHSQFPHQATLLHYCASNGVETERQVVPDNLLDLVDLLLELGSDKQSTMKVYDGDFTPFELASTSAHPKKAGIINALCDKLK